jgi:hypothetical protein
MANLQEKTDYNNTNDFTSYDLDISWAYLQVKKLYELELAEVDAGNMTEADMTITPANFVQLVKDQYTLNQTGSVAETATDLPIITIPGNLSTGALSPSKKLSFKKLWMFNDIYAGAGIDDSVSGKPAGTLENAYYTNSTGVDQSPLWISGGNGLISLDDDGQLRSDRNWTFYIKGTSRTLVNNMVFNKGGFEVALWVDAGQNMARISSTGTKWVAGSTSIHNFYFVPLTDAELNNKTFEMSVVREGISIRLYINGQECLKSIPGDQPNPIYGGDSNTPITIKGSAFSSIEKVYITELDTVGEDVLDVQGNYLGDANSYSFVHDMDIENSFFAFKQYFPDKFGNFSRIFNTPYGPDAAAQVHWVTPPALDTSNGFVAKDKCLKLAAYAGNEYMTVPGVDFKKNFTFSFWFSYSSTYFNIVTLTGEDGTQLTIRLDYNKTEALAAKIKFAGVERPFPLPGLGGGADVKWQHITLVKNGNFLTWYGNGDHQDNTWDDSYFELSDVQEEDMGVAEIRFDGYNPNYPLYLSHIRVLPYAVCQIPKKQVGQLTDYGIFPALIEPIEPGRVS